MSGGRALPPRWSPQCSCVVIESSFDPGERLQAPWSLWFPVLIADHSQAKYFSKYLSLPSIDVISYSGFRISQMFEKIQPTITNYNTMVLHVGANDLACGTPVKKMLQLFQALASGIWELNPTVDILLSGLLPKTDNQFPGALQHTDFIADVNQKSR